MKTRLIILILGFIAGGALVWWLLGRSSGEEEFRTRPAQVDSIRRMLELCSADIREEIAIKDSINGKWIVARQTVNGRIRFDLDSMRTEMRGDTLVAYLPPEHVDILEDASPGAYEVLDSWDGSRRMFGRTLTAAEENAIKIRWQGKVRERIYGAGFVEQARKNAVETLRKVLSVMPGPVIIVDPQAGRDGGASGDVIISGIGG